MDAFLVLVAVTLSALLGQKLALEMRADAFKDPGGMKLPLGEVLVLGFAVGIVVAIGFTYRAIA